MARDITSERLLETVTYDWQSAEELRQKMIETVPPGKALRTYQGRYRGTGPSPFTEDEQIASGARAIVHDRINALINSGRLEFNENRTQIRMAERRVMNKDGSCLTCHRPFRQAPTTQKTSPSVLSNVVYPSFPSWDAEWGRKTGSRTS